MLKKIIILFIGITSFSLLNGFTTCATETQYTYCIQPGTEEWGEYNHAERVELLNIDEKILDSMATEELVNVVLNYPLFRIYITIMVTKRGLRRCQSILMD